MRFGSFAIAAGFLTLGLAMWTTPAKAQGPLYDRVQVDLPYSVTLGDKTLQPGNYTIRQLPGRGNTPVLLLYSDDGSRYETAVVAIPAENSLTPDNTKVLLHHLGADYYFDKIWIQGKNYGYEFPLPRNVKERQQESAQPVSVAATYQPEQPQQTAQAAPPPPPPPQAAAPAPQPEPEPTITAQAAPPAQPEPQPAPPPPATENRNREMPSTASNWLLMLLGGSGLAGAGLFLRRLAASRG